MIIFTDLSSLSPEISSAITTSGSLPRPTVYRARATLNQKSLSPLHQAGALSHCVRAASTCLFLSTGISLHTLPSVQLLFFTDLIYLEISAHLSNFLEIQSQSFLRELLDVQRDKKHNLTNLTSKTTSAKPTRF